MKFCLPRLVGYNNNKNIALTFQTALPVDFIECHQIGSCLCNLKRSLLFHNLAVSHASVRGYQYRRLPLENESETRVHDAWTIRGLLSCQSPAGDR